MRSVAAGGLGPKSAASSSTAGSSKAGSPLTPSLSSPRALAAGERSARLGSIALATVAGIAAVWFVSWAKGILIPLSFAVFLAVCLTPAVLWLSRHRLPCAIGAALVMLVVSGLIGLLASRTRGDVVQLLDQVPSATRYLRREIERSIDEPGSLAHRLKILADLPAEATAPTRPAPRPSATPAPAPAPAPASASASAPTATVAEGTKQLFAFTGELAAVLFLVYLLLAASDRLQIEHSAAAADEATPSPRALATFAQFSHAMHRYLGMLILSNTLLGLAVWGTFDLLGMQRPGAWGVAVALVHFVPYVGSAVCVLGATLLASIQFHSLAHGVLVGGTVLVLSALIGVALQTWLSGRSVRMNTLAVFVSLMVWGWLWGLPGLLLATPLTVALKILCRNFPDLQWIATLLDQRKPERRHALTASMVRAAQRLRRAGP